MSGLGSDPLGGVPFVPPAVIPAWVLEGGSAFITLMDLSDYYEVSVPVTYGVTWWDGDDRLPVTKKGRWDGAALQTVTLKGHRTAIGIDPIQQ